MGYLDKSSITVDAILTKRGREKLASGDFTITKFALADDEVDYALWDESHSKGTLFYGQAIENLPMIEAIPDESKVMRFKLMTLSKNIQKLPFLQLTPADATFTLTGLGSTGTITAKTSTSVSGGANFGDTQYTAIISDKSVATFTGENQTDAGSTSAIFGVTNGVASIQFFGNPSEAVAKSTTLTIVGNQTGITGTVAISVPKLTT
tara:strand:- start:1874 stop:2494 length:621 start_codon:yes stop_codon:yes gene_type:complete